MSETSDAPVGEFFESIQRLTRDLRNASRTLSDREARFLTDVYYQQQKDRIRAAHQSRTLSENDEPHSVLQWVQAQRETLENDIRRALDAYSGAQPAGIWCRSITGIGPVIAAGLLANIDIKQAPTVGHIWRFAGLDPTMHWEKNTKRPWNASLKRLCFLIGESFVKVSNNDNDTYGKIYKTRKEIETAKNEAGDYAEQATASLAAKRFGDDTQAKKHYLAGRLPPARIHLRAERVAVKRFLYDLFSVMYWLEFRELPPKPWIISHGGHVHFVPAPNMHLVPGMEAAFERLSARPL